MTIHDVVKIQADGGDLDWHIVHLAAEGFTIAHTDAERASGVPLSQCELHRWLSESDCAPARPGLYVAQKLEQDDGEWRLTLIREAS